MDRWYANALSLGGCAILAISLAACASHRGGDASDYRSATLRPYKVGGHRYTPRIDDDYSEKGLASWYSYPKGTRRTATGEPFDPDQLTAAHKTLPLPCIVEVTNLENGRKLKVRVNDRGPFVKGRIIDLSKRAADKLGFEGKGLVKVKVKFLGPAKVAAATPDDLVMLAQADKSLAAG
jgi:rare lipoprotein A